MFCEDCNRFFKSLECFDRHKARVSEKRPTCMSVVKCKHCNQVVKRVSPELPQKHNCGLVRCTVCQQYVNPDNLYLLLRKRHYQPRKSTNHANSTPTRFTYSKTLKALVLNFRTVLRSVTRMYSEIITENFGDVSQYFGLVKCTILPPRQLLHPVLPYRVHGKLMFPLCQACVHGLNQEACNHTDEQRSIQ